MRSGNSTWICHPWELDYCPSYGEGGKSKPLTRLAGAATHRCDISSRFQQVASSSCSCSCRTLSQGRRYLVGPPDSAPPCPPQFFPPQPRAPLYLHGSPAVRSSLGL